VAERAKTEGQEKELIRWVEIADAHERAADADQHRLG
jgi:hypothetical protein